MTARQSTGRYAATTNMRLALEALLTAINAPAGTPRIAIFFGQSGYGKTVAAAAAAARNNAIYLRIEELWTRKTLLEKLCHELGIARPGNTAMKMFDQIKDHLNTSPQPIILDEMDYAVERSWVNVIRDIADGTDVPILLIGEPSMPQRLMQWERFDNRIVTTVQAVPATREDGRLLRDIYKGKVHIEDDLVDHFVHECRGVARRIVVNLATAARIAVDELALESMRISLKDWGNRPVASGKGPKLLRYEDYRA
jgi:DNA transposition AAA+ family ATPase